MSSWVRHADQYPQLSPLFFHLSGSPNSRRHLCLGISVWPNILPSISIWDAAAPPQSQGFVLVAALFIIPFILIYTVWSYYVFRGKVRHGEGYH